MEINFDGDITSSMISLVFPGFRVLLNKTNQWQGGWYLIIWVPSDPNRSMILRFNLNIFKHLIESLYSLQIKKLSFQFCGSEEDLDKAH